MWYQENICPLRVKQWGGVALFVRTQIFVRLPACVRWLIAFLVLEVVSWGSFSVLLKGQSEKRRQTSNCNLLAGHGRQCSGSSRSLLMHELTHLWDFVQVENQVEQGTFYCTRWQCCWSREGEIMASYLLHGNLHITIYGAQVVVTDQRKLGGATGFIKKVSLHENVWTWNYCQHPI